MSRMSAPSAVLLAALLCCALPAGAQAARRISSDPTVPDSSRVLGVEAARAPMAVLPIWIGADNCYALYRSEWESMPRVGPRARFGITMYLPLQKERVRNWTTVTYEEDALETRAWLVTFDGFGGYVYTPIRVTAATTLFSIRTGLDHVVGVEANPIGFLGAGVGFGHGMLYGSQGERADHWSSYDFVVRGGLYAYPSRTTRLGLIGLGAIGYRLAPHELHDVVAEFQLGVTLEGALTLPKRFVEQP